MEFEAVMAEMANLKAEDLLHDCRPVIVVFKDGRVQRFLGNDSVPPSLDTTTSVESKDVVINAETVTYVRLYKPRGVERSAGVLVYYHGGAFCVDTAASPMYHSYLNSLSSKANMIVVSVDYRRPPEHPLPVAYEDSWDALRWLSSSHDEPWIKDYVDLSRVFLAGDSAGANIAHHLAKRIGKRGVLIEKGVVVKGIVLVHPYFWGKERIGSEEEKIKASEWKQVVDELWMVACPGSSGSDDPLINPEMDPEIGDLGVENVMVCIAEQDLLRDRGFRYKEALVKSGWKGHVFHLLETIGEGHVFHLFKGGSPEAVELMNQIITFCNSAA